MIRKRGEKWCLMTQDGSRTLGCHDTEEEAKAQERAIEANKHRSARQVILVGAADVAAIRTATFNGIEHVVVPVVALMEGVIHASNSEHPEFVPAEELEKIPTAWNGRPTVPNHPLDAAGYNVSANDPRTLEQQAFGYVFNARMKGKRLCMEAWLDRARCAKVGRSAQSVIERCEKGEPVEVSVGVFTETEQTSGEYKGKRYAAIWRNIVPDHLAMLPEGVPGACSLEMGCGAPRAASAAIRNRIPVGDDAEIEQENIMAAAASTETGAQARTLRERILGLIRFRSNASEADMSNRDLEQAIDRALRATEPGYLGIDNIFPSESIVVYAVAPEEALMLMRRKYSVAQDGTVELASDKEEVRPITRYEAVAAAMKSAALNPAACGCTGGTTGGGADTQPAPATPTAASAGGGSSMARTKQERVRALIACPKTPYADVHAAALESMTEDGLKALEDFYAAQPEPKKEDEKTQAQPQPTPPAPAPTQPVTPPAATPAPTGAAMSEEEYLRNAPESVRTIVSEHKAAQAARHATLVGQLKGAVNGAYTDAELTAMTVPQLEKLAVLTKQPTPSVDFSGRAVPRANAGTDEAADPPPSLAAAVRAAQGKK